MNYFKGKQFQKDVIIVAAGLYLRYPLSFRQVTRTHGRAGDICILLTILSVVGIKNTESSSIKFGRKRTEKRIIHVKWMRVISK